MFHSNGLFLEVSQLTKEGGFRVLMIYFQGHLFWRIMLWVLLSLSLSLSLFFLCPLHSLTHCSLYGVNLMPDSASKASTPPFLSPSLKLTVFLFVCKKNPCFFSLSSLFLALTTTISSCLVLH